MDMDSQTLILLVCGVVGVGLLVGVMLFAFPSGGEKKSKKGKQEKSKAQPKKKNQRKEQERKEQEKKERQRKEQEKKEQEKKEQEKKEQEKKEQEKKEQEKKEQEKIEQAKKEQEKKEQEKKEQEKKEQERKEQERKEQERKEQERKEQEKKEQEKKEQEKKEQEKKEQEQHQSAEHHKHKRNRKKNKNKSQQQEKQEKQGKQEKQEKQEEQEKQEKQEKQEEHDQPKKRKNLSKTQRQRLKREREAAQQKIQQNAQVNHNNANHSYKGKGKEESAKKKIRVDPTSSELENVAEAAQHLWDLDVNRLVPNKDYVIDPQEGKKVYHSHDAAVDPLFKYLNKELFFSKPTYSTFYHLLDNYERSTGQKEVVTKQEEVENWKFLDAICETPCIQYLHHYLAKKQLSSHSEEEFKKQLYDLWFALYRREGYDDSSGFEHVFVGEEKDGKVIGFHNWIQFFIEEMKGKVDYRGYILPRRMHRHTELPDGDEHLLSLQFSWGDELKSVSTSFIGVSPEFEVALYSLMFLVSGERTEVELDDFRVAIRCYHIKTRKGVRIGTSFPELLDQ